MSRAPLGADGAFMHRGRLRVHYVLRIIAESVYVRVGAYLRGDIHLFAPRIGMWSFEIGTVHLVSAAIF